MRQLLYVSDTGRDISPAVLDDILEVSRRKNRSVGVTGLLLYLDGGFLQVLEGNHAAVEGIYAAICSDQRHWNVTLLLDHEAPRAFSDWSMGFEHLRAGQAETKEIFQITSDAIAGRLDRGAAQDLVTLLRTFYRIQCGANES